MGCLDESGTYLHILVFEWLYDFEKPDKKSIKKKAAPQRKKLKGNYENNQKKAMPGYLSAQDTFQ
jgi:hypothetical protein